MRTRVTLKLGGKTYRLLPGPAALDRVGREVGDPPQMVVALAIAKELGKPPPLAGVVDVLHIALEESDYEIGKDDLWKLIYEHGAIEGDHYEAYAEFLGALINRGVVPEVPEIEEPDAEPPETDHPKTGNRQERRAKKAKARARTGKPKS